jgi:hypothetical protein
VPTTAPFDYSTTLNSGDRSGACHRSGKSLDAVFAAARRDSVLEPTNEAPSTGRGPLQGFGTAMSAVCGGIVYVP